MPTKEIYNRVMTIALGSTFVEFKQRIESRQARIGIVGMGYVGLPLALLFSDERFRVTGFDIAPDKVNDPECRRLLHRPHSSRRDSEGAEVRLPRHIRLLRNRRAWMRSSSAFPLRWTNITSPTSATLPAPSNPSRRTFTRASSSCWKAQPIRARPKRSWSSAAGRRQSAWA